MKSKKGKQIEDNISKMEAKFSGLAPVNHPVSESVQITMLVSSLLSLTEQAPITASIYSMKKNQASWN